MEQRQKAVDYYVEHGKSISRTVKNIGYPSSQALGEWITELAPDQKKHCCAGGTVVKYPRELKEHAVISLCSRSKPAKDVAAEYGTTRETLYIWKRQLLDEGCVTMKTNDSEPTKTNNGQKIDTEISNLDVTRKELEQQVVDPQNEVRRLKLERDIYEKAAEILKKDEGISLKYLSNREKAIIINALRDKYQLKDLLKILNMAKSSYSYQAKAIETDKYATVRIKIEEIHIES